MQENQFEQQLIQALTTGQIGNVNGVYKSKLWEYKDIHTIDGLWDNFKYILEKNNQDKLEHPLSDQEFRQVRKVIEDLTTPYKAGQFLYGYNGVSQVEVNLDDGRHVYLTVFDQDQIGAGDTVYQVVNQIVSPAIIPGKKDRRFDVTLLINGLPIIQIELKEEHHDVNEALNQMHQYIEENQYTGIFSTLQILVGMTPYDVRYMANATADRFNKDFAFHWQNEKDNSIVRSWHDFADQFLSIPAAHRMSTNYMILDGTENKECIKVMRPYQVYATKHVIEGLQNIDYSRMGIEKIGYIWHTTGSGKTITSFKTAWLASRLPGIDKVVFLVDRKALTRQTFDNYRAYDPENTGDNTLGKITDTRNTQELIYKLKQKNNDIVITSVQKLERMAKRKNFKAPERHFVFIVDEAHRSTNGDAFRTIQKAFPHAAWVGYTGTPRFNDQDVTTSQIFGHCLHAYTIREAIKDKNVLGFKVDFDTTIPEDEEFIDADTPSFYDCNESHVRAVVADIFKNWKNRSVDGKYNALLTTKVGGQASSIPMAMMYYHEFKRVNEEHAKNNELTLKVGITFSQDTSNSDNMHDTNSSLSEAIKDYNKQFKTNFGENTVSEYMTDLTSRLNRTAENGEYLDLVIVVDQLLTGFDAPELNTLYVDRMLKGATLIQAYSRTNRIADMQTKPYGNVINYRWPEKSEEEMNKALEIYSNAKNADDSNKEGSAQQLTDDGILAKKFPELINETRETVSDLRSLTNNFIEIPASSQGKLDMLQRLRVYNAQIAKLKQYSADGEDGGYDYEHPEKLIEELGMDVDENKILTTTLTNELKREVAKENKIQPSDIDLRVEYIKEIHVDYDYLTELIEKLMNQTHDNQMAEAKETRESIIKFTASLPDQGYAKAIIQAADAIYNKDFPTDDSDLTYPYHIDSKQSKQIIEAARNETLMKKILNFRNKWGLTDAVTGNEIKDLIDNHTYGVNDLDTNGKLTDILSKGAKVYKEMSTSEEVRSLKKLKYRNSLRKAMSDFADQIVSE